MLIFCGWLGSRVVSVLDSGAEGPAFKSQSQRCRQTVHTHCASVYQAAKLAAALLRVARVTAGLPGSNGSLPPGLWLTSPAGWLPRTGISSGTLRSVIEYGLLLPILCWFYLKNFQMLSVKKNITILGGKLFQTFTARSQKSFSACSCGFYWQLEGL